MTASRIFANTEQQVKQLFCMYFFISVFLPLFKILTTPNLINQAVGGIPLPRLRRSAQRPRDLEGEDIRDGNHKVNSNGNPRIENSGKNKVSRGKEVVNRGNEVVNKVDRGNEVVNKVNRGNEVVIKAKALSSSESAVGSSCKHGTLIKVAPHPM